VAAGPFTVGDDAGEQAAAATVGRLAAALGNRRRQLGWSQAFLAQRSGVGQHTVGHIEAGRTWRTWPPPPAWRTRWTST
jgi:ribosome-binding protein aMBF1 (putative translation factor)